MRSQTVLALTALLWVLSPHAAASEARGQVLAFQSARAGLCLFEPRIVISETRQPIAAGDALEFELFVPAECAELAGVEIVFADGRRSFAPPVARIGAWHHVRIALAEFAPFDAVRFELIARGALADEIGYRVDDVVITHADGEPTIVFTEALPSGARIVRDDRRQVGMALVDVASELTGVRSRFDGANLSDPWQAYDLSSLRKSSDGELAVRAPIGRVLVGSCVPMHFADRTQRESLRAEGQKFLFEPLEGGRYYTVWFALSTTDGEALTTRCFAFGDAGEHRPIGLFVPKRGDPESHVSELESCLLVPIRVASFVPISGIELPNEPRLRIHALTFQWHKDGASDERFYVSWLRDQAELPNGLSAIRAAALSRWCGNREIGPSFGDDMSDPTAEREMFTMLVRGFLPEFDALLKKETLRQSARGTSIKSLHLTLEEVRDDRDVVRIESGIDPELMLRMFAAQAGRGAFVLEGDPAFLRQAPQIMTGFGSSAALLTSGPRIARWIAADDSSVLVHSPFRVLKDAREFGDLPWRQWSMAVTLKATAPELLLAIDGSARVRADAKRIVKRLFGLSCLPNMRSATAEDFVAEAGRRLGAECPTYAPPGLVPVPDDRAQQVMERAPALRRAANAVATLSVLTTPAFMDGSDYPRATIDVLRGAVQALDASKPSADAARIVERAEAELARELEIVARGASTLGKGTPFVAFNALPWSRRALVELESPGGMLFGSDGAALPWQATPGGSRVFALDVPALGYHVVRGSRGDEVVKLDDRDKVSVSGWTARNGRLSFTLDPATGAVTKLGLVNEKLELLAGPAQLVGEGLEVESAEFTEKGPLRAIARVVMSAEGRRVELELELETRSFALQIRVRTTGDGGAWRIPGAHAAPRALFGVPFGFTTAGPHANGRPARHRIADWAATTDANSGIGILAGNLATVLVEKDALTPELAPSAETVFALVPFTGGWRKACLAERAWEFSTPLALIATDAHPGARAARHSFMTVTRVEGLDRIVEGPQCGVVMSAFEPTETDGAFIVRLAETHGAAASLTLDFDRPVFGADVVDLRGTVKHPLRVLERRVEMHLGPNRIETVRVQLRP